MLINETKVIAIMVVYCTEMLNYFSCLLIVKSTLYNHQLLLLLSCTMCYVKCH